jgi:hypothetical protein
VFSASLPPYLSAVAIVALDRIKNDQVRAGDVTRR